MGRGGGRRWLLGPVAVLVIGVLVPLATLLVGAWVAGWHVQAVRTGSMEPALPVNSAILVEPLDPSEVRVGMAVMFADPAHGRLVTHRIVEVLHPASGLAFRTRGDANPAPDPFPVPAHAVRGRVRWQVRGLGAVMLWLRWPRPFVVLVVLPTIWLAVEELRAFRSRRGVREVAAVSS